MTNPRLDYQSPESEKKANVRLPVWVEIAIAFFLIGLTVWMLLPAKHRQNPYHGNRGKCVSNLRQLGQAIELYANENQGAMPTDWATLVIAEDLVNEDLVCPSSNDEKAVSTQPADLRAEIAAGGHCSYTYLGTGQRNQWTKDDVIAFDTVLNHDAGIIALFGDGHCESVDGPLATQLIAQSRTTSRPIRLKSPRTPELCSPR